MYNFNLLLLMLNVWTNLHKLCIYLVLVGFLLIFFCLYELMEACEWFTGLYLQ